MINDVFDGLELNWLQKNYTAVNRINSKGNVMEMSYDSWKSDVTKIWFGKDSKLSDKAIMSILLNLKELKEIDLNEYNSEFDIKIEIYNTLKENNINVIFNKNIKYSDSEINKIINHERYVELCKERDEYKNRLDYVNAAIADLGIIEYI